MVCLGDVEGGGFTIALTLGELGQGQMRTADFEVRLYENDPGQRFDIIYGASTGITSSAAAGVQGPTGFVTQDFCNTSPPQTASRTSTQHETLV